MSPPSNPGNRPGPGPIPFCDRLADAVERKGSCLVVGIDPVPERFPREIQEQVAGIGARREESEWPTARAAMAIGLFGREVIRAVAGSAVAVKPNCAFFERFGPPGWEVLLEICRSAREAGLLVIVDAKRSDLQSTAEAYAEALLGDLPDTVGPLADAITLNPYLGSDGIRPFLARAAAWGKGLFILVRTSNPSAAEIQDQDCGGRPLYLRVAGLVHRWGEDLVGESGLSSVGAVVGATAPRQALEIREVLPRAVFLVPGYGAQGAGAEEVRPHFLPGGRGAVVNASRSVIYAYQKDPDRPWREAIALAAARSRDELEAVRSGR